MTIDLSWFERQIGEFTRQQPLYEQHAQTLKQILDYLTRPLLPDAILQVRVKTVQSFAEKALRKREKYPDPVNQFTDLCGGRIITQLQAEVDAVCRALSDYFTIDEANSVDALARLRQREFGYRSRHYIVKLKPDACLRKAMPVTIAEELLPLKAEIQVRTLLQHAWAGVDHERMYLSPFKMPPQLVREGARLAAAVESADEAFGRYVTALDGYKADYGGYVDQAAMRREVEILQVVRKHASKDERLAHQIARLFIALQDWDAVIRLLEDIPQPADAGLLCCIGYALCQRHKPDYRQPGYLQGRALLEEAIKAEPHRVEAYIRLAETWIEEKRPTKVLDYYTQAFNTDPSDPQALQGYVRYKIATEYNISLLPLLRPTIRVAVDKCRAQGEAGVNLPWALYQLAELTLLLGPEASLAGLDAYLRAMKFNTARHLLEQALEGLHLFEPLAPHLPAIDLCKRLLVLVRAVRYGEQDAHVLRELKELASPSLQPPRAVRQPIAIVAGGCDPSVQGEMAGYRALVQAAFERFRGTLISGGTREGIPGLVGELGDEHPDRITTVGYLPAVLPADGTATLDMRYHIRRITEGKGFSALEPIQSWIDLVGSGVAPERVRVLGINGGDISSFEYRLGLLLGAKVGLVRDSGRKANALALEAEMEPIPGLALLPADPRTIEAFLTVDASSLSDDQRELMAQRIHENYCSRNRPLIPAVDPALKPWEELSPSYQRANLQQADDFERKLAAIGKRAVPVQGREIRCREFTVEEIESLAEMEHGRYVAQKLLEGWTLGPRDDLKKQRPTLIGWKDLSEEEKRKDREAVQNLPRLLQELGFEIQQVSELPQIRQSP